MGGCLCQEGLKPILTSCEAACVHEYGAKRNTNVRFTRINSRENYEAFLNAGFSVLIRDENRTIEETFALVEKSFGLGK